LKREAIVYVFLRNTLKNDLITIRYIDHIFDHILSCRYLYKCLAHTRQSKEKISTRFQGDNKT